MMMLRTVPAGCHLLDSDTASHACALVWLAVVLVCAWLGELGRHLLAWCIEVVLVAERVDRHTLLHKAYESLPTQSLHSV